MALEILPYDGDAEGVLRLYADATASVPHSFPASLPEVAAWLEGRSARLESESIAIAREGGEIVGLARYGRGGPDARPESWFTVGPGEGILETLLVRPGDREAAELLLTRADADLRAPASEVTWAFEDELGPPFSHGGFGQISATMATPLECLCRHGFTAHAGELHLVLDRLAAPPPGRAPAGISVTTHRLDAGEWALEAHGPDGAHASQCVWAPVSLKSRCPVARRVGYVWWLGVDDGFRGRGLGRHMMRCAFQHMRDNGITAVWLTTGAANYVAQSLYLSLGFRVVDYSLTLVRRGPQKKHAETKPSPKTM